MKGENMNNQKIEDKIVAMGEIMLRLTPPDYGKIEQATSYLANYGGGEANVAVSLSHLGHHCLFLTKLPPNELGEGAVSHLRSHGIDTSYIVRGSSTMGCYFLENGFGGRPGKVIYNRKHSAATRMSAEEFDFDKIFENATWFHLSGITLALSEAARNCALKALEAAKKHHVKISFDFNYRSKLWTIEEAQKAYPKVMPFVDVLFASPFDFRQILQFDSQVDDVELMKEAVRKYHLDYIFGKTRTIISATENEMKAYVYAKDAEPKYTDQYRFQIFDRIGAGDAYAAGVIDGLTRDYAHPERAAQLGLANCILKQTIFGDVSLFSREDLMEYLQDQGVSEVKR
jgi:2-dehydro-3-deoxygluconokinase